MDSGSAMELVSNRKNKIKYLQTQQNMVTSS